MLQVIFDRFYDENRRDPEGLFALKKLLSPNQVQCDIRKNYHAASHLLNEVTDILLLIALETNFVEHISQTAEQ